MRSPNAIQTRWPSTISLTGSVQGRRLSIKRPRSALPISLESIFGQFPTLAELTEYAVKKALEASNNNQSEAAKVLGISKQALSKRLKKKEILTRSTLVDRVNQS